MAEEEEEEEGQEGEEGSESEEKKGGILKWIIIGVVAVAVIGGISVGAWFFFSEPAPPAKAAAKKGKAGPAMAGPIVQLKPFIVNLADPGGRRYLRVALEIELDKKESEPVFKSRLPEVRDQIILALSSKSFEQIQGVKGKMVLREELTARLNTILKAGTVKKTFFTDFVVQ